MRRPALKSGLLAAGAFLVVGGALALAAFGANLSPGTEVRVDAIALSDSQFAFAPDPLPVPANRAVSIILRNTTNAPHTLILLEPIDAGTAQAVAAGGMGRIDFNAPQPGTYRFVCNVHENMAGAIEVR